MSPLLRFHRLHIVNSRKTLSFTTLALLASLATSNAYFRGSFRIDKTYRQFGQTAAPTFVVGSATLLLTDGTATQTGGCLYNGDDEPFGIDTRVGCNIGSNGVVLWPPDYISWATYHELVAIEPATTVEPGRHDLVRLNAKPPSDFPSSLTGIDSSLVTIFYNLRSSGGGIREYRLTGAGLAGNFALPGYQFTTTYNSRSQMEKEIVHGYYQFQFPQINTLRPLYLNFPVTNTVEGYVKNPVEQGFRFVNLPPMVDGFVRYSNEGIVEMKWEGMSPNLVSAADRLYVSLHRLDGSGDPAAPAGDVFFPPAGGRVQLASPLQNSYNLPASYIYQVLGGTGSPVSFVLTVELERDPGAGVSQVSSRKFELPISVAPPLSAYALAIRSAFPGVTDPSVLDKDADPDGDGIPNWLEWVSGSDPAKANAPKTLSAMAFVPPSAAKAGEPQSGYWQMMLDLPEESDPLLSVDVEFSEDLKNWSVIGSDDPKWEVDRSEPNKLRVISKSDQLTGKRYFRVKYGYAGQL